MDKTRELVSGGGGGGGNISYRILSGETQSASGQCPGGHCFEGTPVSRGQ